MRRRATRAARRAAGAGRRGAAQVEAARRRGARRRLGDAVDFHRAAAGRGDPGATSTRPTCSSRRARPARTRRSKSISTCGRDGRSSRRGSCTHTQVLIDDIGVPDEATPEGFAAAILRALRGSGARRKPSARARDTSPTRSTATRPIIDKTRQAVRALLFPRAPGTPRSARGTSRERSRDTTATAIYADPAGRRRLRRAPVQRPDRRSSSLAQQAARARRRCCGRCRGRRDSRRRHRHRARGALCLAAAGATVTGVDASAEMLASGRGARGGRAACRSSFRRRRRARASVCRIDRSTARSACAC